MFKSQRCFLLKKSLTFNPINGIRKIFATCLNSEIRIGLDSVLGMSSYNPED